jgi:hypothetical protein
MTNRLDGVLFRDHVPSPNHGLGPLACEAPNRIKEAAA